MLKVHFIYSIHLVFLRFEFIFFRNYFAVDVAINCVLEVVAALNLFKELMFHGSFLTFLFNCILVGKFLC